MNQKTPADLDPKLKEAYDRVMGGNLNQSTPPPPPVPPKMQTPASPPVNSAPIPTPLTNPAPTDTPPLNVMSPTTASSTGDQVISTKKKSRISPLIFLIVGVVFFIIYAVVWGKVFKLF